MDRRRFLKLTGAVAAGLALGLDRFGAIAHADAANFEPSALLQVSRDGSVTLWVTKTEMGQGVSTSLPMILAEELEADWKTVKIRYAKLDPKYGDQDTGGSESVRGSYDRLRRAAAAAREMLVAAAAKRWGVLPATCHAENGAVLHAASKRSTLYRELVGDASKLPVPADPRLKEPRAFRLLGQSPPRFDIPSKVTGAACYGIDVRVAGMLFASIERCPTHGGRLVRHESAKALAVAGVQQVVALPNAVAVVASDTWSAFRGRAALDVVWDPGPLASLDSASIDAKFRADAEQTGVVHHQVGDFAAALARSGQKLESVYTVPYLAHAPMEPQNATVLVTGNRCRIWAPVQIPSWAADSVAKELGIPRENIDLEITLVGGGFGRRLYHDYLIEAALVAKQVQGPVQLVYSRADDMRAGFYRPASLHRMTAGVTGAALTALRHRVICPSISQQLFPGSLKNGVDRNISDGLSDWPYSVADYRAEHVLSDPGIPVLWWRSVYNSQNPFASECFLDECARAAGKDPLAFRLALLKDRPRHAAVLKLAAQKAGWGRAVAKGHGLGLAMHASFGSYAAMVAEVSVEDGAPRVHRAVIALDCGQVVHPDTIRAQLEGAVMFGLSAALHSRLTFAAGATVEGNFDGHAILRLPDAPRVEVHLMPSSEKPGGVGEPGVPVVAPSVANALFAATGQRLRNLPLTLAS